MNSRIHELREQGWGCAQTMTFMALEKMGEDNPTLITGMGALNGGIKSQEVCGILSGAAVALELLMTEKGLDRFTKDHKIYNLVTWFEREFKSINCRDLRPVEGCKDYATMLGTQTWDKVLEILEEE